MNSRTYVCTVGNVYNSGCHPIKGNRTCPESITVGLTVFAMCQLMDLSDPIRHLDPN